MYLGFHLKFAYFLLFSFASFPFSHGEPTFSSSFLSQRISPGEWERVFDSAESERKSIWFGAVVESSDMLSGASQTFTLSSADSFNAERRAEEWTSKSETHPWA